MTVDTPAIPRSVRTGLFLVYASLVPGIVDLFRGTLPQTVGQPAWLSPFKGILVLLLLATVVFFISRGRNWARVLFTLACVLGVPVMVSVASNLAAWLEHRPGRAILLLTGTAMQLAATILFYRPEASRWFRAIKAARETA